MKARLHHIAITNFKAFREFSLNLEGRHLLVYGANCYDPCGSPWMMEDTGGVRASAGRGRSIL